MNIAKIQVSGNVGSDPEIREVGDTKVANFSVAVNENFTKSNGEKVEKTHWYTVEAWDGKNGSGIVSKIIQPHLKSGETVFLEGFPLIESYTDKEGVDKKAFKIKLAGFGSTFRLVGGKKSSTTDADTSTTGNQANGSTKKITVKNLDELDDDIPF